MPWPGARMFNGSNRALRAANRPQFDPKWSSHWALEGWWAKYCLAPMWGLPATSAMWRWLRRRPLRQSGEQVFGLEDRRIPTTYTTRSDEPDSGSTADVFEFHLYKVYQKVSIRQFKNHSSHIKLTYILYVLYVTMLYSHIFYLKLELILQNKEIKLLVTIDQEGTYIYIYISWADPNIFSTKLNRNFVYLNKFVSRILFVCYCFMVRIVDSTHKLNAFSMWP